MSITQLKIAITAGLFLCIFVFGFWLSRSGKPYNGIIFTIHKLVALGAVIYLLTTVFKVPQAAFLNPTNTIFIALSVFCFLVLFVSGVLLSLDKAMPLIVVRLHHVTPYLALISTSASLYLLLVKSSAIP